MRIATGRQLGMVLTGMWLFILWVSSFIMRIARGQWPHSSEFLDYESRKKLPITSFWWLLVLSRLDRIMILTLRWVFPTLSLIVNCWTIFLHKTEVKKKINSHISSDLGSLNPPYRWLQQEVLFLINLTLLTGLSAWTYVRQEPSLLPLCHLL